MLHFNCQVPINYFKTGFLHYRSVNLTLKIKDIGRYIYVDIFKNLPYLYHQL